MTGSSVRAGATTPTMTPAEVRRARRRAMFMQVLGGEEASIHTSRAMGVLRLGPDLEHVAPRDAVGFLYRAVLGREPDPEGLAEWSGHVESGLPVLSVAQQFAEGPEASLMPASKRAQVRAELRRWSTDSAVAELGIAADVAPTYTSGRVAQEILVRALFEVALQRAPSPEELQMQTGLLASGASRETLVRSFAHHPEALARLVGGPVAGLRARARQLRDRLSYMSTFRALVLAAESRRIAALVVEASRTAERPGSRATEGKER